MKMINRNARGDPGPAFHYFGSPEDHQEVQKLDFCVCLSQGFRKKQKLPIVAIATPVPPVPRNVEYRLRGSTHPPNVEHRICGAGSTPLKFSKQCFGDEFTWAQLRWRTLNPKP